MKIPTTPEELVEFCKEQNLTAQITAFELTAPSLELSKYGLIPESDVHINITLRCGAPEDDDNGA